MNPHQSPDSSGRALLLLSLLLLAALTGVALLTRPLIPIDETRYVSAAWEMWLRGDFLVPFKNGEPYSHKPPFMFWMFHAGWALFGVNDWWPRLVLPLFSAGALLLTYSLARSLWPQRAGLLVDPERDHGVCILVCNQQQCAGWIDGERAGL
jgi:4-amino-4-deoxy-L-arabinose transferase-like glycosyltransferase